MNELKRPQNCGTGYCSCIECVMEPEQEPVARVVNKSVVFRPCDLAGLPPNAPLYTAPPQRTWVGLTDEEIDTWNIVGHESLREFVRAIEAKLKEKNT